jgi:ComF family protein
MCAVVAYERSARAFLLRAKLGRRPELFALLGAQLSRRIEVAGFAEGCTVVLAVPSRPWITALRGFSPAHRLARPVARTLRLPLVRRGLHRRLTAGGATKLMSARRRRRALEGSFVVRSRVRGERVLLIDDVVTTGSTVAACASALRAAGAAEVRVAAWARTLPRPWATTPEEARAPRSTAPEDRWYY